MKSAKMTFVPAVAVLAVALASVPTQGAVAEIEPNDSLATAQALPNPASPFADVVTASLSSTTDFDIFSIDLEVNEVLTLITTPLSVFGDSPDTELGVVDPSATWAAISDDDGQDSPEGDEFGSAVRVLAETAGTYYVVVSGHPDLSPVSAGDSFDVSELGDVHDEVGNYLLTYSVALIPEPATMMLLTAGLGVMAVRRRR